MGISRAYTQQMLPKLLMNLATFLNTYILTLLKLLGLAHIVEPQVCWPETGPDSRPVSASILQEMLPAMKFADLATGPTEPGPHGQCAVCLHEFRDHEEIRRLANCRHIFHRVCVDRWMDHDQMSCPLCRAPFVPDELMEAFHEKLGAAAASLSAIPEFGGEFSVINNFL